MRAVDILRTAVSNTFRSKLRTTLTVLAIFIGAFTLTITNGLGTGINNYITTQVASLGANDVMSITKPKTVTESNGGPSKYVANSGAEVAAATAQAPGSTVLAMTKTDLDKIGTISGISSVAARVSVRPAYIEYADKGKYQLSVSTFGSSIKLDLAAGSALDSSTNDHQLVVPTTYIKNLGLGSNSAAVGKTVTIAIADSVGKQHTETATIVGVQQPSLFGSSVTVNDALQNQLYADQSIGLPDSAKDQYSSVTAKISSNATTKQVDAIKTALTKDGYSGTTVADQLGTLTTVINGIILVLNAFAVIALLAAGFGIINTLLMSVQERTREIGLMKAMGMSAGRIFGLFSTEAAFIGFLGSAIGSAIAIGVGTVISAALSRGILSGLGGLHILTFAPSSVITVIIAVMLLAFVAGTLPALRAARQSPIESLRYE